MTSGSALQRPLLGPGARVSHYEIAGVIGRGGMGIVYRAIDLRLSRPVALKLIRPDRAAEPDYKRRALREARLASRLSHPSIVKVLDVFEVDELPAIVMELVEGPSLRAHLEGRKGLPVEEVLGQALDLVKGLGAAHAARVLHRDVNPNNVLVCPDGRAVLTDFGLARSIAAPGDAGQQSTGTVSWLVVGTPGYMAPEQLLGRPLDGRVDLFALGAVVYEMCTGARAIPATGSPEVIDATLHREALPFAEHRRGLPEELERIVRKALAKRPDDRYQDAGEMEGDLRALSRALHLDTSPMPPPAPRRLRPSRRRLLTIGGGALALAAAAVLGAALWQRPGALPKAEPRKLAGGTGYRTEPTISPDGTSVAYASRETGAYDIWLADAVSGQTLRLTDDEAPDRAPAFFPDSSGIAFSSERGGATGIWKTTRLGGLPTLLVPDATDPAISPDGTRIAFVRPGPGVHALRIWVAPLEDVSQAVCLTRADGTWDHRKPRFSPDGRTVCYEDFDGLWLVPAAGGTARGVATGRAHARRAAFGADGRSLYCSDFEGEARALWRVPFRGAPERLSLGTGVEDDPSVSRDGQRLAYSTKATDRTLVLFDRRAGTRTVLPSLSYTYAPALARDGSWLAFAASTAGRFDVFGIPLSPGGRPPEPQRVTSVGGTSLGNVGMFALSGDGATLAFHTAVAGRRDIFLAPRGGEPVRVVDHPAGDYDPALSPDGRLLAFASDRDRNPDLWVVPIARGRAAGPPRRLTREVAKVSFSDFSPAGDAIAFVGETSRGTEVWRVPLDGSRPAEKLTSGAGARMARWVAAEFLLVAGTWGTTELELREVRLPGGEVRPLSPPLVLGDEDGLGLFGVTGDGARVAYVEERSRGEIWLLEAVKGRF